MQWGLLAPATVLLGGAGLLAFAGGAEISEELGSAWQALAAFAAGVGLLALLLLLYVLNWRAARVRAARAANPFLKPRRGGFWKGAMMGALVVVAIQLASIGVGIFYPGLVESERNFFVSVPPLALAALYTVFPIAPLVGGLIGRVWRATNL
ncbi:TPA: ABC transporter permease [Stenotrophomonas maltophilia]|nr:ABC transporter permease [Stenotrophomonas maltophilia]MBH1481747.1 ABC transporter permease [Stenotrophomonas maltophilia]HDS1300711.1 ABC transporter permease [Stenotrophomonas maltophilia]HDS1303115.1 ABC transporter permease [Stenotrophomonas maltophilia]